MVSLYLEEQDAQVSWHTFLTCTWLAQCPDEIPILLRLDLLGVFYCVLLLRSFSSVTQLCPTLCEPTDCNTPGFPVYHQFLELAHTHVHWVNDAIQPSHPLCPLLLLPSIFPSIRVLSSESVLHIKWPKYWSFSFSISPSNEYSGLIWLVWFPCSPRVSQESSPAPQFKGINSLVLSFLYGPTLISIHDYWENHSFAYMGLCWQSDVSAF